MEVETSVLWAAAQKKIRRTALLRAVTWDASKTFLTRCLAGHLIAAQRVTTDRSIRKPYTPTAAHSSPRRYTTTAMSKVTFAVIAAGGAAAGAAATAAFYSTRKDSVAPVPVATTATTATRPTPIPSVPTVPSPSAALRKPGVDPSGLFQYGFPGPVNDLRPAASLTSAYDRRTKNPAWVAEHITPESLANSNADRKHSVFVEDVAIPEKFRAKLKDYFRSGYDRGHQVPAADAKWSQQAMDDTFALSNMCPQVGEGFNRDYWAHFEDFCRRLTKTYPSVRIVTGPLYLPKRDADG